MCVTISIFYYSYLSFSIYFSSYHIIFSEDLENEMNVKNNKKKVNIEVYNVGFLHLLNKIDDIFDDKIDVASSIVNVN